MDLPASNGTLFIFSTLLEQCLNLKTARGGLFPSMYSVRMVSRPADGLKFPQCPNFALCVTLLPSSSFSDTCSSVREPSSRAWFAPSLIRGPTIRMRKTWTTMVPRPARPDFSGSFAFEADESSTILQASDS